MYSSSSGLHPPVAVKSSLVACINLLLPLVFTVSSRLQLGLLDPTAEVINLPVGSNQYRTLSALHEARVLFFIWSSFSLS